MAYMNLNNCLWKLKDNKFDTGCGYSLSTDGGLDRQVSSAIYVFCPKCGRVIVRDSKEISDVPEEKFKLILPLKAIPENTIVKKVTGDCEFIVKDSICIYSYNVKSSRDKAHDIHLNEKGFKYIINPRRHDISRTSEHTEVIIELGLKEIENLLKENK